MRLRRADSSTICAPRRETRVPIEVGVHLTGHVEIPGLEATFTEDISSQGARVFSIRRWQPNDRLMIGTVTGSFHALARVAYCQSIRESGFVVGLEFLDRQGDWIIATPSIE